VLLFLGRGNIEKKEIGMIVRELMLALAFPLGITLVVALAYLLRNQG
jgi:hypothetical protein